jgi:7-cyano-7-deazaguanine synthase
VTYAYESALVLLSGGYDSAALLAWSKKNCRRTRALFVDYGQTAREREQDAASRVCTLLQVSITTVGVSWHLPCGITAGRSTADDYVPARNLWLCSLAVGWAECWGMTDVLLGAVRTMTSYPNGVLPDTDCDFVKMISAAARVGTKKNICVRAPFVEKTKRQIRSWLRRSYGDKISADIERASVSCYGNGPKACGVCNGCRGRKELSP